MELLSQKYHGTLLHLSLPINTKGKDYFIGDIHGQYDFLTRALKKVKFNKNKDRLICTGDLIDRGKDSFSVLSLLDNKSFFSVLGNHEDMLLSSFDSKIRQESLWYPNGGNWWKDLNDEKRYQCRQIILDKMPLFITVKFNDFYVGVVHGDFPLNVSWEDAINCTHCENFSYRDFLWRRNRVENVIKKNVDGLNYLFLGHTPLNAPSQLGNCYFIDTGCGHQSSNNIYNPALTICTIIDGSVVFYHQSS